MYSKIEEFAKDYAEEAKESHKNFEHLTDGSLETRPAEGYWSIGDHLWHIIQTWTFVFKEINEGPDLELPEDAPGSAAELAALYKRTTSRVIDWFTKSWTDEQLAEGREMWGMKWTNAKILAEMLKHEIHHHGQMIPLMRMAGLPVHGIYGPSKEEMEAIIAGQQDK